MNVLLLAANLQLAFAGASVSNFKKDSRRGNNYWNAGSAIDSKPETAWMVSGESENKGEWILIDGPSGVCSLDKIAMVNGYAKSEDTYTDYSRVKEVRIDVLEYDSNLDLKPTSKSRTVSFEDKIDNQVIDIEDLKIESENGGKFRITVTDFFPGKDYSALGVSEVMLHLGQFEISTKIVGVEKGSEGSDEIKLFDGSTKSFWLADEGAKIELEGTISRLGIVAGPSTYARPKKVKVSTGGREIVHELLNTSKEQWLLVPSVTGYTGSNWDNVTIEIMDVYPGKKPNIGIAEIKARATTFDGF
jgi:hypothetical protein